MFVRKIIIFVACISMITVQADEIDTRIAVNEWHNPNAFVVIISNENYKHEEKVPYAINDGSVFRLYCEKTLGIPANNIKYVPDASLNDMNYYIAWLEKIMDAYKGQAKAIFYYSGHGMPDEDSKESYLLPTDGYSSFPGSGISTTQLYSRLGKMSSSGTLVLLDACFSGAKREGGMLSSSRGVAIKPRVQPIQGNLVIFSAATGNETAYPYKAKQHGLFTYCLLKQLQKKGGCVTLGELSENIKEEVVRTSIRENEKSQTPTVMAANNDWRNWKLAEKRASKFENITGASVATPIAVTSTPLTENPKPTIITSENAKTPVASGVQSSNIVNLTPPSLYDSDATLTLVAQGKKAMRAMQYIQADKFFLQAANQNSLEAFYQLGLLYINSNFNGHNKEKAFAFFEKAASCNHADANYQLGLLWRGTDNTMARKYFRKAAGLGHTKAQTLMEK
ncbi:MAG: caspase family protein [Bacteroidaceae bacterium]|nr:caspase family protein [Bacteroidaceae bacterium]